MKRRDQFEFGLGIEVGGELIEQDKWGIAK
jgi:hypothetical protein